MLDDGSRIFYIYIRESMSAAIGAEQEGVALRVVFRTHSTGGNLYKAAIRILTLSGLYTFAHYARSGIGTEMYHLRTGIGLLEIICKSNRIEFSHRIIAFKDT